jgi:hypothetical protein
MVMTLKYLMTGAAVAFSLAGVTVANAQTHNIGVEDPSTGFTGNLFGNVFPGSPYLVASDGEDTFQPFGATFDVSDGLDFSGVGPLWVQAGDSHWTEIGHQTWVLPASTACGNENEPSCEPVGHFVSPIQWNPLAIGRWNILDADGSIGDIIVTFNTADGAELRFYSDPLPAPEASTWTMMLLGFGGLGAALRIRKTSVALTA